MEIKEDTHNMQHKVDLNRFEKEENTLYSSVINHFQLQQLIVKDKLQGLNSVSDFIFHFEIQIISYLYHTSLCSNGKYKKPIHKLR